MRPLPTSPELLPTVGPQKAATADDRVLRLSPPSANQRRSSCPTQSAYPWLLVVSTLMAGVFCFLYISKPVIVTESALETATALSASPVPVPAQEIGPNIRPAAEPALADVLPGDRSEKPHTTEPAALRGQGDAFEETNLRIQHVLGAETTWGDDLGRIVLDVPVLYQSGQVRWTQEDVSKARALLSRIGSYQERSRELREEAVQLISEWDQLVVSSIPETALRADSPTLPENQGMGVAEEAKLNTTDSIEIETP